MTKVRAIKDRIQVKAVTELLLKHYGEHFAQIWQFALNVGLRMGDVLSINMADAKKSLRTGYLEIKEQKTKKYNRFEINAGARLIIEKRKFEYYDDVWLFQSHGNNIKRKGQPISRQAVYAALVSVGDIVGIKLGTHSARKTRARIMYEEGTDIAKVSEVLNHASIKETMNYLDITEEEKQATYHETVF